MLRSVAPIWARVAREWWVVAMRATYRLLVPLLVLLLAGCGSVTPSGSPGTATPAGSPTAVTSVPPDETPAGTPVETPPEPTPPASPTGVPPTSPPPSLEPSGSPGPTIVLRNYYLLAGGDGNPGLVPVLRTVPGTVAVATAAMNQLVLGPTEKERNASPPITSAIPAGTRFLDIAIAGGIATVNLSHDFEEGGGSFSVRARLGQVVYTLTQFSTVRSVAFKLDGVPVEIFSPEGIILDHPLTRADFHEEFLPGIFVDRPAWGAALPLPGRVTGLANVFEAYLNVELLDDQGRRLAHEGTMATCGTGCWGTFDVSLPYVVSNAQWGTLRAWADSPKDGSPLYVRPYPAWLVPPG